MAERAAARAGLYRLLALAFDYPRRELLEAMASGAFQEILASSARTVGVNGGNIDGFPGGEPLESAYLRLFELGEARGRPCALRESAHVGFELHEECPDSGEGPPSLMEDLLRFYHHFGLRLSDDPEQKLPPDHIVCQFEMLAHLGFLESGRGRDDDLGHGYRNAQRDFLRRHVAVWLPKLAQRLRGETMNGDAAVGFYAAMADLASAGVAAHLADVSRRFDCGNQGGSQHVHAFE